MANQLSVEKSQLSGVAVVALHGAIDAHTAGQFEQAIQSEIDSERYKIVVNCEKLSYISSAGLGVFMGFVEEVREQGGDIKICCLSDSLNAVFELLGFQSLFEMFGDVESAVKKFAEGGE